jgi:poly(3-hydroxyalkanoate) synthetase
MIKVSAQNARRRLFQSATMVQAEQTPFEVIYQKEIIRLRYYPPLKEKQIEIAGKTIPVEPVQHAIPLVLVAPLAVNMYIYDLFADRSLVKYLQARGFKLYLVDWGCPKAKHNHFSISTYFADLLPQLLTKVREHSGSQKLSLHGWSFGGLFSYSTACLDKDIVNLALIGAPCDYHKNGALGKQYQRIAKQLRWAEDRLGWRVHNTRKRWWRSPGWANALAFKLTNPVGSLQGYLDLIRNLHDEDYVTAHATNGAFLDNMVAYPGAVIQDVIQYLWTDNLMGKGLLPMKQAPATLSDIHANVLMVCGKTDPIVTKDCGAALLDFVSSKDKTLLEVPGGHMGILSGSQAPEHIWPKVADWLIERSQ